jgi:formyl-CoA transferase
MPALDGLRILDMTQYEAGTSATQALAWMGADVVKIEPPEFGDPGRGVGVDSDYSAYFCNWNANKRSLALDLSTPEGRDVLLRMLPRYDVFIENYGPGVIERLGLEYGALKAVHPSLIYAQLKGFGSSGPYSGFKSYDMVAQAAAGTFSVTGAFEGPPTCPGPTTADSGTGVQLAMAILAAIVQRLRTGQGQFIEISMQEAMTYYMRTRIAVGSNWGEFACPRLGNSIGGAPTNLYPCDPHGPNDWAYIMTVTDRHWDALCMAMERDDLVADTRFVTGELRQAHAAELYEEIAGWTRSRSKQQVMEVLGGAGVPCSANLDTRDLFNDPHLNARGFVHQVEHPQHGEVPLLGFAPRMSASSVDIEPAPLLGEHSDEVLSEDLKLTPEQLAGLRERGIIR